MKVTYAIASLSSSLVLANEAFENTLNGLGEELDPKKFSSIVDMAYHMLENEPNFMVDTVNTNRNKRKNFSYMLQGYGCHCFPTHKSTIGGKGAPVDALDEACRALYRCHKCIDIEAPGECDTDQGGYKYQLIADGSVGCDSPDKKKDCQEHQCQCDRHFAETVRDLWVDPASTWTFNPDYWLNPRYVKEAEDAGIPVFDSDATCVMGANVTPNACCGDSYPNKVPYADTTKACCAVVSKPYNSAIDVCCATGVESAARGCF